MEESEEDGILMSKHLPDSHPATLALPLLVSPPHLLPSLALSPSSPSPVLIWPLLLILLPLFSPSFTSLQPLFSPPYPLNLSLLFSLTQISIGARIEVAGYQAKGKYLPPAPPRFPRKLSISQQLNSYLKDRERRCQS